MYLCMIYICLNGIQWSGLKSYSDQLSIATSKNRSVVNTICICSFLLNSCDCLRPEYNFFLSPDKLSGINGVTLDRMNFRPNIRQNLF